jgi:cysteine desulfurase
MEVTFLDNAATTKISDEVKQAMMEAVDVYGNPSSSHALGRKTKALIERNRRSIAAFLKCLPSEIIFTSGGTEADNLAILGTAEKGEIKHLISSRIEHKGVINAVEKAEILFGVKAHWVNLLENGEVDLNHLEELLKNNPNAMVSLMHVNNEVGNVLDIKAVANMCQQYNALFHSDTVQSMCHEPIDLSEIPVDFVACSGHKLHGPKGIGFLFMRKGKTIVPQINGGGQERSQRAGTENIVGIAAIGKCIEAYANDFDGINNHILQLKQHFISELRTLVPDVQFNGNCADSTKSVNTVVSFTLPEQYDQSMLLFQLDMNGLMVSGGSACNSGAQAGSHVLAAIGKNQQAIRASFSKLTTMHEVDHAIAIIAKTINA